MDCTELLIHSLDCLESLEKYMKSVCKLSIPVFLVYPYDYIIINICCSMILIEITANRFTHWTKNDTIGFFTSLEIAS